MACKNWDRKAQQRNQKKYWMNDVEVAFLVLYVFSACNIKSSINRISNKNLTKSFWRRTENENQAAHSHRNWAYSNEKTKKDQNDDKAHPENVKTGFIQLSVFISAQIKCQIQA